MESLLQPRIWEDDGYEVGCSFLWYDEFFSEEHEIIQYRRIGEIGDYALPHDSASAITEVMPPKRPSVLFAALQQVDEEEDINKVLRYFSYEHFYVIYYKFWELDSDHDFLIDKYDLLRYGNHALTPRIVERIYSQIPRKFTSKADGKMGYEDFVWFILSEEDKSSEPSLQYWFKCVDLHCDGVITPNVMQYFYEEQLHRMERMAQKPVLSKDIVRQMADMIGPAKEGILTLRDLKRCKLSGNFFDILFNLNKLVAFETRDPFLIRQEREEPSLTEWDWFARMECIRFFNGGRRRSCVQRQCRSPG